MSESIDELQAKLLALAEELKPDHVKFAIYLAEGNTAETSYNLAKGKKIKNARSLASRLLSTNANIHEYVRLSKELVTKRALEKLQVTEDRIMLELARIGFSSSQDYYDKNGKLLPVSRLTENAAAAITEIKETALAGKVIKRTYKLADKKGALQLLGNTRNIQMFNEKRTIVHDFSDLEDDELDNELKQLEEAANDDSV